MNITAVSSSNKFCYSTDNNIKILEKQKMQLQKQLKQVNESKMDPKIKQEKIKAIQEQIESIETQIQQQSKNKVKCNSSESKTVNISNNEKKQIQRVGTVADINSAHMLSAVSGYSYLQTMGKVRTELKNKLRIATSSGKYPAAGQSIEEKIDNLEDSIIKKSNKINNDLRKTAKKVEKTANQDLKNTETAKINNNDKDEVKKKVNGTENTDNQTIKPVANNKVATQRKNSVKQTSKIDILI
ncbi:FlxA-like family protein [Clostridium sp. 'deep sea']|uniref:FlxA-like family protein n=1 Tax=Clostridium sp. 'deep sea' TaxID=2779445 RepID=UPI001896506D|nr:FlxA-like family protein [Clostridium sp. 'deep sea']QOR35041.1 FlxA-like family protein [Clostridium sp. 'deep sea']